MAAYITAAQMLTRYDSRRVAELNSDTGSPVTPSDPFLVTSIFGAAAYDASAMVDTALQAGGRYRRDILAALVADPDPSKGAPIVRVVCDLTYARMLMRRGLPAAEIDRLAPAYKDALKWVEDLASGKTVLDITAAIDAGLPEAGLTNVNDPLRTSNWNRMFGIFPNQYNTYGGGPYGY